MRSHRLHPNRDAEDIPGGEMEPGESDCCGKCKGKRMVELFDNADNMAKWEDEPVGSLHLEGKK